MFGAVFPPLPEVTFRRRVSPDRRYAQAMAHGYGMAMGFLLIMGLSASAQTGVIGVIQDFESGFRPGAVPCAGITTATSRETVFGQTCLQVTVAPDFAWRWKGWADRLAFSIGTPVPTAWALIFLVSWAFYDNPTGLRSALIYAMPAGILLLLAAWPNPVEIESDDADD